MAILLARPQVRFFRQQSKTTGSQSGDLLIAKRVAKLVVIYSVSHLAHELRGWHHSG